MKRLRIGKKEKNIWRQIVEPTSELLPRRILVNDFKLKETKPKEVTFKLCGWKDKWPLCKLIES